jgi:hypothetical protein
MPATIPEAWAWVDKKQLTMSQTLTENALAAEPEAERFETQRIAVEQLRCAEKKRLDAATLPLNLVALEWRPCGDGVYGYRGYSSDIAGISMYAFDRVLSESIHTFLAKSGTKMHIFAFDRHFYSNADLSSIGQVFSEDGVVVAHIQNDEKDLCRVEPEWKVYIAATPISWYHLPWEPPTAFHWRRSVPGERRLAATTGRIYWSPGTLLDIVGYGTTDFGAATDKRKWILQLRRHNTSGPTYTVFAGKTRVYQGVGQSTALAHDSFAKKSVLRVLRQNGCGSTCLVLSVDDWSHWFDREVLPVAAPLSDQSTSYTIEQVGHSRCLKRARARDGHKMARKVALLSETGTVVALPPPSTLAPGDAVQLYGGAR